MRKLLRIMLVTSVVLVPGAPIAAAQTAAPAKPQPKAAAPATGQHKAAAPATSQHKMVLPDQVQWGPAPPSLPPGAQMAVLDGDPSKPGMFTIRARFPVGWAVPAHCHPTDEHVVVFSGTFMVGLGDKADPAKMHPLTAGSFAKMPRRVNHFASAKGETILQIYGAGPFVLNYVNPADDPRKKTETAAKK